VCHLSKINLQGLGCPTEGQWLDFSRQIFLHKVAATDGHYHLPEHGATFLEFQSFVKIWLIDMLKGKNLRSKMKYLLLLII
jgi:hypothetical protein